MHLNKENKATERLGDLAQVLLKGGRTLMVLAGEKDVSELIHGHLSKLELNSHSTSNRSYLRFKVLKI